MRTVSLALVCTGFWLTPLWSQTLEQQKATIAYLRDCQQPDGGFLPAKTLPTQNGVRQSSLRAGTAALRALKYFGGEPRDRSACERFVERCFDKSTGGFADHPRMQPDVASTAVGLMAVVELKLPVASYREPAVDYLTKHVKSFEDIRIAAAGLEAIRLERPRAANNWLVQLANLRHADGTFGVDDGVARATGGAVVAWLRLGGEVEHRENVLRALETGQRADGGFGKEKVKTSDLETSYRVMRAFAMLHEKPDVERCRAFVARCRNPDGGYGVAPGQPSSVAATYFASIILHWLRA
jgi:prenyltransferase beta subunit